MSAIPDHISVVNVVLSESEDAMSEYAWIIRVDRSGAPWDYYEQRIDDEHGGASAVKLATDLTDAEAIAKMIAVIPAIPGGTQLDIRFREV